MAQTITSTPGPNVPTVIPGFLYETTTDNIVASGNSQANGTPLFAEINRVTNVAPSTGVNLPSSAAGLTIDVISAGANPLTVYPAQNEANTTINGLGGGAGVSLQVNAIGKFYTTSAGNWWVDAVAPEVASYSTNAAAAGFTIPAAAVVGADNMVVLGLTGAITTAQNAQMPTVASIVPLVHSIAINNSYVFRVVNLGGTGSGVWTITTNTGWTLNGTMSVAVTAFRDFIINFTALGAVPTATLQNIGSGAP